MSMFRSSGIRNVSIAKQIAHTAILPLGNKDFKLLQDLITAEKAIFTRSVSRSNIVLDTLTSS